MLDEHDLALPGRVGFGNVRLRTLVELPLAVLTAEGDRLAFEARLRMGPIGWDIHPAHRTTAVHDEDPFVGASHRARDASQGPASTTSGSFPLLERINRGDSLARAQV